MADRTNIQIPPPKNWQDFERLCCDLWAAEWNEPLLQLNGRHGQRQNGVDLSGRKNSRGGYHALQCKGRDRGVGRSVSVCELEDEVKKAREFEPPLESFTLVTTADDDAKLQTRARELTLENEKLGIFSVNVLGWSSIEFNKYQSLPADTVANAPAPLKATLDGRRAPTSIRLLEN